MPKDVPAHLLPAGDQIIGAGDDERKLNQQLDTGRWAYIMEPDDGICPYCGNPYKRASWASRHEDARTGVCPYDVSVSDFIVQFVHQESRHPDGARTVDCFCSPEYDDTLVTHPNHPDYDIQQL
jgi:hypothetical protein